MEGGAGAREPGRLPSVRPPASGCRTTQNGTGTAGRARECCPRLQARLGASRSVPTGFWTLSGQLGGAARRIAGMEVSRDALNRVWLFVGQTAEGFGPVRTQRSAGTCLGSFRGETCGPNSGFSETRCKEWRRAPSAQARSLVLFSPTHMSRRDSNSGLIELWQVYSRRDLNAGPSPDRPRGRASVFLPSMPRPPRARPARRLRRGNSQGPCEPPAPRGLPSPPAPLPRVGPGDPAQGSNASQSGAPLAVP